MNSFLIGISIMVILLGKTEAESECADAAERKCGNTFLDEVEDREVRCSAYDNAANCVADILDQCHDLNEEELDELDMTVRFLENMGIRCEAEERENLEKRGDQKWIADKRNLKKRRH